MIFWKQARPYILALTFLGVILVLLKSIFDPAEFKLIIKTFTFPEKVPLAGWHFQSSYPLENITGKVYNYKHNEIDLQIKMQHELGPNREIFRQYNPNVVSPDKTAVIIRKKNEIGVYILFIEQERAYLRSCINPNAPSVITQEQFTYNRYISDLRLGRLLPVFLNQEPLIDRQCFWANLSIPVQNNSPENAYEILENAWIDWYPYWHSQFP